MDWNTEQALRTTEEPKNLHNGTWMAKLEKIGTFHACLNLCENSISNDKESSMFVLMW